jgi:hypothetical protein
MTLTSDGVNLAGVRRLLELQEQTRLLQAEIDRLMAVAPSPADRRTHAHHTGPAKTPGHSRLAASYSGKERESNAGQKP